MLALIGIFYTAGELLVCLIALLTMQNLKKGNWRLMLALSSVPGLLCFLISYFFLFESPRFLMISGKEKESI